MGVLLGLHCGVSMCCEVVIGADSGGERRTLKTTITKIITITKTTTDTASAQKPIRVSCCLSSRTQGEQRAGHRLFACILRICQEYTLCTARQDKGICIKGAAPRSSWQPLYLPSASNILPLHKGQSPFSITMVHTNSTRHFQRRNMIIRNMKCLSGV